MKKIYLVMLIILLSVTSFSMTFDEYLEIVFKKSDIRRDVKLYKKRNHWNNLSNLSMVVPRVNISINAPKYTFNEESEYVDKEGNYYSSENYSYGGNIMISQYLPTNTKIESNLYYNSYKEYREAGIEREQLSGETAEFKIIQNLWATNKGYHYYKIWENKAKINKIENKKFAFDILQKAYEKYLDYLISKRTYLLNKKMYERYKDIYESAKNKYRMGLYDLITYNRIKKEYKFYEVDYKDAKRKMVSEKKKLELFLNTEIKDLEFDVKNINYKIFKNLKPKTELKKTNLEFDNIYRNYKFSKADNEMKLYASISTHYRGIGEEGLENLERDNYSISLILSIPFANLRRYSQLNSAKVNYLIEKYKKRDEIENIKIEFRNLKSDLKNYHEKIILYNDILPDLKENYELSLKRFNMGMITLEELRSIENDYINAKLNYLRVLKSYNLTAIKLGEYIGNSNRIIKELL